jgi:hypothetical protein
VAIEIQLLVPELISIFIFLQLKLHILSLVRPLDARLKFQQSNGGAIRLGG